MTNYELLKLNKDLLICKSCDMPMTKEEDLGIEKNGKFKRIESIPTLYSELVDGQDCNYTGTKWEKLWLDDGRVCHCEACVAARKCISDVKLMGEL